MRDPSTAQRAKYLAKSGWCLETEDGNAGVAQLVERNLAKVEVAGSIPVTRLGHR